MKHKFPRPFLYLLGVIFIINLIQGYFTELIFDEAYYWYYAQNMAWGYFDHPPMVALLIKVSGIFFDGELGVRFVSCILSVATIVLLWLSVDTTKKQQYVTHFFVLIFSMTLLNAYGFLTLPDTPLLFFTALFLWCYKKFLQSPSALLGIALGVTMAALMYSKYHAILVIVFVIISNYKLLFNKYAWLAVLVALACYTPHILWLVEHDFVTIKYHLFERPNRAYDFNDYTLGYFVNLIALFGVTFPWVYLALVKTKVSDKFTRALVYLTYGILIFFFVSSFNRRVQTQWIIVICIPMAILVFKYMIENATVRKWIFRMGIVNIIILSFLRVGLVYQPLFPIVYETHGNKKWVAEIAARAGTSPVIFENSYRNAPMYSFYSGNTSYSLNNIWYRRNQYSIDSSEQEVQGKKVVYTSRFIEDGDISFTNAEGVTYYGNFMEDFESFRKLRTKVRDIKNATSEGVHIVDVYNPYDKNIALDKIRFAVTYLDKYKKLIEVLPIETRSLDPKLTSLSSEDISSFSFDLPAPKKGDPTYFRVSISENKLCWGLNGENVKLP